MAPAVFRKRPGALTPPLDLARLVDAGFESGHAYGKALRTVKSCVGADLVPLRSAGLGPYGHSGSNCAIEGSGRRTSSSRPSPGARECAEARGKDFGVIATSNGWNPYVGGAEPRHADLLARDLSDDELVCLVDRFLMFYIRTADRLEPTSTWLERIGGGLEHVRDVVVHDSLGLRGELEELMAGHVSHYRDEWARTLADPERLSRFVSFVNAPETPDPSVRFVPERDQVKPGLLVPTGPTGANGSTDVAGPTLPVRTLDGTATR